MAGVFKKAAQAVSNALPTISSTSSEDKTSNRPSEISLPKPFSTKEASDSSNRATPRTPRTPADEAIAFFGSETGNQGEVQVWELILEDDGGPNQARSVSSTLNPSGIESVRLTNTSHAVSTSGYLPLLPLTS
jgi:hypothetical protein